MTFFADLSMVFRNSPAAISMPFFMMSLCFINLFRLATICTFAFLFLLQLFLPFLFCPNSLGIALIWRHSPFSFAGFRQACRGLLLSSRRVCCHSRSRNAQARIQFVQGKLIGRRKLHSWCW